MGLFDGLSTPSWISPDESSAINQQAAQQQVQTWMQQAAQKENQDINRLKMVGVAQDIKANQIELNNQAQDMQNIPAWLQEHNTWEKRQNATDTPTPVSKWGIQTFQQVRLSDAQNTQHEVAVKGIDTFSKELNELSSMGGEGAQLATAIIQLPKGEGGLPSPKQMEALYAAKSKMADFHRTQNVDDEKSLITAREKAREDYDVLRQQDRVEMANYNNVLKQDFMAAKGEQWDENWKRHKDYIFSLSRKKAGETFNDSVKLAGIRSELKRAENMPYKDQAAEIQRIEGKYKYEGASEILNNSSDAATATTSTAATNIPTVKTQAEYDALPKGAKYKDLAGKSGTKK